MKRLLFALCLTALVCPALRAQNLSPQERDKAIKYLEESRAKTIAFLKKTDGLRQHALDSPLGKQLDG
jgi:hypothetical protein